MNYTHRFTAAIPAGYKGVGNLLATVIDEDSGGDKNFGNVLAGPTIATPTHVITDFILRPSTRDLLIRVRDRTGAQVKTELDALFTARFPDRTKPTAQQYSDFRAQCQFRIAVRNDSETLGNIIAAWGLVLIPAALP